MIWVCFICNSVCFSIITCPTCVVHAQTFRSVSCFVEHSVVLVISVEAVYIYVSVSRYKHPAEWIHYTIFWFKNHISQFFIQIIISPRSCFQHAAYCTIHQLIRVIGFYYAPLVLRIQSFSYLCVKVVEHTFISLLQIRWLKIVILILNKSRQRIRDGINNTILFADRKPTINS